MTLSHEQFHEQGELFPKPAEHRDTIFMGRVEGRRPIAPEGYYRQPEGSQLALPGMKMTVNQHLAALSEATGTVARLKDYGENRTIELHHPDQDRKVNSAPLAELTWAKKDLDDPSAPKPGEIGMVFNHPEMRGQGVAAMLLNTAERLGREYSKKFAMPRHSEVRSNAGLKWSRARMKERGEEVW